LPNKTKTPWYRDGLRFTCTGCGGCCTGEPGYVWVKPAEIEALAAALGISREQFERRFVRAVGLRFSLVERDNGDCVLFDADSRRCRVYDARPHQCRTWPFWPENVSTPAAWAKTARRCPGCNRGRLVPLKRIAQSIGIEAS
jgi:Fe-S-cluster containining protein